MSEMNTARPRIPSPLETAGILFTASFLLLGVKLHRVTLFLKFADHSYRALSVCEQGAPISAGDRNQTGLRAGCVQHISSYTYNLKAGLRSIHVQIHNNNNNPCRLSLSLRWDDLIKKKNTGLGCRHKINSFSYIFV